MTDQAALLQAILAEPDDDLPRLVYADWLDEYGRSLPSSDRETAADRAAFIRAQIELARAEPHSPDARAAQEWADRLARLHARKWGQHLREYVAQFMFVRGFVEHVAVEAVRFPHVAEAVFEADPIRAVRIVRLRGEMGWVSLEPVFESPRLQAVSTLELPSADMGTSLEYDALTASPFLAGLKSLSLNGNPVPPQWLTDFLAGPELARLTSLDLSDNAHLGPSLTVGLERAEHRRFMRLNISGVMIRSGDLQRALACPCLEEVEELRIGWKGYPNPGPLTHLDLGWVIPWTRLRVLDLFGQGLGPEGVREIARKPEAANLRWLGLAQNELGVEGARLLAATPHLNLYYLDVRYNNLDSREVAALRQRFPEANVVA